MNAHEELRRKHRHFERKWFKGWRHILLAFIWDDKQYYFEKRLLAEYQELKQRQDDI